VRPSATSTFFRADRATAAKFRAHFGDAIPARRGRFQAGQVFTAVPAQLVDVETGELRIQETQRAIELVGLCHLDAERGEHRCVLARDHAAAEYEQRARQVRERQDGVAVEDVLVIDGEMGGRARPRTGGDDDDRRAHAGLGAVDAPHGQLVRRIFHGAPVRRDKSRATTQQFDAVALELCRHVRIVRGDGLADTVEQRLDGLVEEIHPAHALAYRMLAQRLAGNRAGVHARAADPAVSLDDGDTLAGFRGLDRRLLPGGARTDDDDVVAHAKLSAVA
jgi:hypothetical protein